MVGDFDTCDGPNFGAHVQPTHADTSARSVVTAVMTVVALAVLAVLCAAPGAADPTNTPVTIPDSAVDDNAGILNGADRGAVLAAMATFTADTGIEVTVVTTNDSGGQTLRAYAGGQAAGLGRDRGQAIVVAADLAARSVGIFTTRDAQTRLPDDVLQRISTSTLAPKFKDHHYRQGFTDSLTAVAGFLRERASAPGETSQSSSDDGRTTVVLAVAALVGIVGWAGVAAWNRGREQRVGRVRRAQLGRQLRELEPELRELATPRERYQYAKRLTDNISVSEWNAMYPQWHYVPVIVNSTTDTHHGGHSSGSSTYTPTDSSGGFSAGGFDGGGGATSSF